MPPRSDASTHDEMPTTPETRLVFSPTNPRKAQSRPWWTYENIKNSGGNLQQKHASELLTIQRMGVGIAKSIDNTESPKLTTKEKRVYENGFRRKRHHSKSFRALYLAGQKESKAHTLK